MKTEFGQNPTNMCLSFTMSLFVFSSAWLWQNGAHFVRAAVRVPFVNALNLHRDYPPTFLKALADLHPDQEVWLKNHQEEKGALQPYVTYRKITLGKYPVLQKKGALRALPTM